MKNQFVIPAEAGIHMVQLRVQSGDNWTIWTPAFAGVTLNSEAN
jgi:hypothetical protein